MPPESVQAIVFFDADCAFCRAGVAQLAARDCRAQFRFAPLAGITAQQAHIQQQHEVVVQILQPPPSRLLRGADATAFLLQHQDSSFLRVCGWLLDLCPSWLAGGLYRLVAHWRRCLPLKPKSCASLQQRMMP